MPQHKTTKASYKYLFYYDNYFAIIHNISIYFCTYNILAKDDKDSSSADKESLELSSHEITSESSDEQRKPKSTEERKGW